ncbi:unnamed protein product [Cuscuta europaea]|uniref:Ubiquitin-like protease family profile domain-containing protein n=1 Tax=Cuscuta europaea TaxID=41803 RepID=A0A9P0YLQ7_CUSEU|nr:unnamed protein product [Cuscuta europaea]
MLSKEDCVKEIIAVAQKFSDAFVEFSKLPSTIAKKFPNSDILKKIYLTTADYFINQANGNQAKGTQRLSEKCVLEEDDDFFNEPGVMEALEKLEKAAFLKFSMPSFDIGIEFNMSQGEGTSKVDVEAAKTETAPDVQDVMTETVDGVEDVMIETIAGMTETVSVDGEVNGNVEVAEVAQMAVEEEVTGDDGEVNKEIDNKSESVGLKPYTRKRKLRKLGDSIVNYISPFLKNNRRLCKEFSRDEKIVLDWGFSKEVEKDCVYIDEEGVFITHEEIQTLQEGNVDNSIIDAFTKIMNDREESNKSTKRAFIASTQVYAMFDFASGDPIENMVDRLQKEINDAAADVTKLDMILFPIHNHEHYYIYCFYTTNNIVDVIDNRMLPDGVSVEDKYGKTLKKMHEGFKAFCEKVQISSTTSWVPRILYMPWRHNSNHVDCGVYTLRHLETFRGQGHVWDSGFATAATNDGIKAQSETIQKMRVMYAAQVLLSKFNKERENILKKAKDYLKM